MPQTVLQIAQTLRDAAQQGRQVEVDQQQQVRVAGRWHFRGTDHAAVVRSVVHAARRDHENEEVVRALRYIIYAPNYSNRHAQRLRADVLRAAVQIDQLQVAEDRRLADNWLDHHAHSNNLRRRGESWFESYARENSVPIGNQYDPLDPNSPPPGYGAEANEYSLHDPALHGPLEGAPTDPVQATHERLADYDIDPEPVQATHERLADYGIDPEPEDGMNAYYEERQNELPSYDSLDTSEWRANQVPSMLEVDQAFRSRPGEVSSYIQEESAPSYDGLDRHVTLVNRGGN